MLFSNGEYVVVQQPGGCLSSGVSPHGIFEYLGFEPRSFSDDGIGQDDGNGVDNARRLSTVNERLGIAFLEWWP